MMKEENIYQRNSFYPFIRTVLLLNIIGLICCFIFNSTAIVDEFEHMRAAWFVSLGDMPYRDFFEHHHPLLWFAIAPLMSVMPHDVDLALYTTQGISMLFSVGSLAILFFMIKRFFGGIKTAYLALALYFLYYANWYTFSLFKPDTFMRFFYLLGLYQFFVFCETKQTKQLVYCGINFTISFFFLQTIAASIIPLAVPVVWMLYKKQITYRQVLTAAALPLIMCGSALYVMYKNDMLIPYIQLNWIFNSRLFKSVIPSVKPLYFEYGGYVLISAFSFFWLWKHKKADLYIKIIALLAGGEIIRLLIFAAHFGHYFTILFIYCAVINSIALKYLTENLLINMVKICLFISIPLNIIILSYHNNVHLLKIYKQIHKEQASVLNCGDVFNIWEPRSHYYWFYPYMEALDTIWFSRYPDFNLNEYLERNQIKYISGTEKKCTPPYGLLYKNLPPHAQDILKKYYLPPETKEKFEKVDKALYKRKP